MRTQYLILLFCSFSSLVFSQEVWNLEKCISYAIENNLTIEISELNLELADNQVYQSKGNFLPNLNGGVTHQMNYGQTIDPFTNSFAVNSVQSNSLFISSNWTIFNGMQNLNNLKRNQYSYLSSKYDLENTKYNIALLVTQNYLNILFFQEQVKIANQQIRIIQEQVNRTKKLFAAGTIPRGSLLEVEAQLAREELNLINTENSLNLAYIDLKQTLVLEYDYNMVIETPEFETLDLRLPAGTEAIVASANQNFPSIISQEYATQSAEKGVSIAKGQYSPTLSFNASLGSGYSGNNKEITGAEYTGNNDTLPSFTAPDFNFILQPEINYTQQVKRWGDQLEENFNQSWGLQLTIPIFNRFQVSSSVNQARINYDIAQTRLSQEKLTVRQNIEKSYADAVAAIKSYRANEKSVESLKLAFDYAQERFDVGMINAVEYNQSKNNLFRAQSELVQAKYDYVFKLKILEYYRGDKFDFGTLEQNNNE